MTIRVFLSSTFRDLNQYREKVKSALERIDLQVERMEVFCAQPDTPLQVSLREVDRCDLFVGIYAYRYGHIPEGTSISMIEAEFNRAEEKGIPRFAFIVDPSYEGLKKHPDDEPGQTKLENFKRHVESLLTRELFTTSDDLVIKVLTSIFRHLLRLREAELSSLRPTAIPSGGATSRLGVGKLPFQQVDQVRKILRVSSEEATGGRLLAMFTRNRREKRFLLQKHYDKFTESFLDACTVELDQGTVDLDRFKLDALAIRAYGLLATAALGRVKRNPGPIQITLKIDPSKLDPEWPGSVEFEQRKFHDWAEEFADYEAQEHDVELLANMRQMEWNDLVSWVDQRYPHTSAGLDRGMELLGLTTRMYQQSIDALTNDGSLAWAILAQLTFSSIPELVRKTQ